MSSTIRGVLFALALASASAAVRIRAFEPTLDPRAIEDALSIGGSSFEATRARFHANYRFAVARPPVDFVEIVTPFRRIVIGAETARRQGRIFGQREALDVLRIDPTHVAVYVELSFHPHNTFIGVPGYSVELNAISKQDAAVAPEALERLPRFGQRLDQPRESPYAHPYPVGPIVPSSGADPLFGGTLIARIAGARVDVRGVYEVMVKDGNAELARARVDFARIR